MQGDGKARRAEDNLLEIPSFLSRTVLCVASHQPLADLRSEQSKITCADCLPPTVGLGVEQLHDDGWCVQGEGGHHHHHILSPRSDWRAPTDWRDDRTGSSSQDRLTLSLCWSRLRVKCIIVLTPSHRLLSSSISG